MASGELVLAATTDDQGIFATDLHSGALVATFEEGSAQPGAFGTVAGSCGHIFAVQAKKALWTVWAWGEKKPCYRASLPEKTTAMAFSGDGALCFAGAGSGSIYVWQMGTGCLLRCWPAHFREVTQLLLSRDETFLISASADATVHVYNLADVFVEQQPRPFRTWSGHSLPVTSLAQLPGNGLQQSIVSASLDRSVRIWDIATGRPTVTHTLPSPVHCLSTSPGGSEIVCACGDGELRSLSVNAASTARADAGHYSGHTGAVMSCALNADGSRLVSCSEADRVRIWETRMRQCISQAHTSRNVNIGSVRIVRRSAFSPGLPSFQPFQRLLTAPEEIPAVPLFLGGRVSALEDELEARARSDEFVDRVVWGQAAGLQAYGQHAQAMDEKLAVAQAERSRWAAVAVELLDELSTPGDRAGSNAGGSALFRNGKGAACSKPVAALAPAVVAAAAGNDEEEEECSDAGDLGMKKKKKRRR